MNRLIFLSAAALPVLVDASLKSAALVVLAGLCALAMHRASAAARHVVWLVALLALLLVPVLSVVLPSWQVLPQWAAVERAKVTGPSLVEAPAPEIQTTGRGDLPESDISVPAIPAPPPSPSIPSTSPQPSTPPLPAPGSTANPPLPPAPTAWLVVAWAAGCAVLLLRLAAAHFLLLRATNRCPAAPAGLSAALTAAMDETGLKQPVRLLLDRGRSIPLVWGIFHPCLLLPAESVTWDAAQLRSVLLHETAHLRRRDPLVQCLMQLACALYWFNPLVWLAAWRLHVERERACDDLVLAKGVKPSVYAGHLLEIASQLTPTPWTAGCGLAMARKSSLEGRLLAVLSDRLDRRNVTRTLVAAAFLLGTGIAVPVAMLRAADEAWTSPKGAHIGSNDFSAFCVHDGKEAEFVIAYHGDFDSTSRSSSNAKSRTWTDDVTLTVKKPGIALSLHRLHTSPGKLSITTAPAEARDLSKPAPDPHDFGQKEYDLAKGRVFLLTDNGTVRQFDLPTPIVTDQESSQKLAKLIAAIPPQERDTKTPKNNATDQTRGSADLPKQGAKLTREMLEGIWLGERDGWNYEIRFLWFTEHQQARWRVWKEGRNFGLDTSVLLDARAGVAGFVFRKGFEFEHEYGKLTLGEGGAMLLDVTPNPHQSADYGTITSPQKGIVLTRQPGEARIGPKHKDARALYEIWQRHARLSGDIPGALIGELAAAVKVFIGYNPTWETVPKLNEILPRLDATRDWKAADAIALLDEVATVQDSPLQTAAEKLTAATIRKGEALPEKFANVAWGETQPNGLRATWVLEPGAAEHRIGTALRARLLVQNAGTIPVMTRVPTWHQGPVKARDATDAEIEVSGIEWTTIARLIPVRLGPGEFIEISAPGVGLGKDAGRGPWAGPRVGSNVLAKDGTELTLTHGPLALDGSGVGMREDAPHIIGPGWWQAHIKARLARELPLPVSGAKRTHLLDRAVRELFATTPTADEIDAFATDQTDGAFDSLVQRLATRAGVAEFSAPLPTAPVKFRVLPADPAADKTPRVVLGPGEYPLSAGTAEYGAVTLKIVGRPVGDRRTNDAQLMFEPTEFTGILPPDPRKLELPDGWGTWAIVCRPGEGFFYLLHKGGVRKIDYTKPRDITDIPTTDLPAEFRDEVKRQLDIAGVPAEQQAELFEKPAPPAAADPKAPGTATTPEPRTAEAPAKTEGNLVNARATSLPGTWALAGGVSLHIYGEVFHGSDVATSAILSWPALGNRPAQHWSTWIAGDVFAARSLYAVAWDAQHAVLWIASRDVGSNAKNAEGKPIANRFTRVDFSNPNLITEAFSNGWPMEHPPSAEVMAQMATLMEVPQDQQPKAGTLYSWSTSGNPERINLANVQNLSVQTDRAGTLTVSLQSEKKTCTENELAQTIKALALNWEMKRASTEGDLKPSQRVTISTSADFPAEALQKIIQGCTKANFGPLASGAAVPPDAPAPKSAEAGPRADVKPVSKMLFNEDYAAFAVQSEKDVNFVLFYQGDLSSGISEWSSGAKWRFNGNVYLVDPAKTAVAGKNVNKRAISVQYTSDEPKKLYLDGKAYDLAAPMHAAGAPAPQKSGRVFILRDEGEPIQTNRTLALRDEKDLVTIGNYAVHDSVIAADPSAAKAPRTATAPGRYVLGDGVHLQVTQITTADGKRTNKAQILFVSQDPRPYEIEQAKPYDIGFYNADATYAIIWERGAKALWVTEISEGARIPNWMAPGGDRLGPEKVTVRGFDFSNPWDVKLTHVSSSENGGDWSWGKIVPAAFHQPVLNALGERGKRLRDFLPAWESRKLDRAMLEGTWEGEKDGATVEVEFQWLSEHQQVRWEVKRPSSSIGAQMSVVIAPDGNSAEFIFRKGLEFEATQGRLTLGEGRTLNLEIIPNPNLSDPGYPAVKGLVLKPNPAAAVGPAVQTPLPANGNLVSVEPGGVSLVTSASYNTDSYPLAEGLSIVVRSELYHGADTSTDVVAHWAATENRAATHAVFQVASDTMGNRQPWAVLWENGSPALWLATGKSSGLIREPAGKTLPLAQLVRIDLRDPENLVGHEFSGIPEAGGPSAAVLEKLRARMTWDGTGTETTRTLRWAQPTAKAGKTAGILHVFTRDAGKFQVSNGKPCDLDGLRESIAEVGKHYAGAPHQFTLVGPPSQWEMMQQAAGRLRGWHPTR